MARLRAECGWKAAQTHRSLAKHLLEETYETLEAIEALDARRQTRHLREELGDVLLQVYLHAAIAAETGAFDIEDVAAGLREKMIRRNPHVFGDVDETDPARINETWEAVKASEKQRADIFDGIPLELPALTRAAKVLDRIERAGGTPAHARSPTTSATACWPSSPRRERRVRIPSRRCVTPYDGPARDPNAVRLSLRLVGLVVAGGGLRRGHRRRARPRSRPARHRDAEPVRRPGPGDHPGRRR